MRIYKERRLYFFNCDSCGNKNRQSFHRKKVVAKVCRKCRRHQVDPNQPALFPEPVTINKEVITA